MWLHRTTPSCLLVEALKGDSPFRSDALVASSLTTLEIDGSPQLAVKVHKDALPDQDPQLIQRPHQAEFPSWFTQLTLRTSRVEDKQLLVSHFGVSPSIADVPGSSELVSSTCPGEGIDKAAWGSKLGKRLTAMMSQAGKLLDKFSKDEWVSTPESGFTRFKTQAGDLWAECGQVGEKKEVMDEALKWSNGLSSCKRFLGAYRNFVKSHHKISYLEGIFEPLTAFHSFLVDTGRDPAPSLQRMFLKVHFHNSAKGFCKLSAGLKEIIELGLVKQIENADSDFVPEVWLRSMVFAILEDNIAAVQGDDLDKLVNNLVEDVGQAWTLLHELASEGDGCFSPVAEDLSRVQDLLNGWFGLAADAASVSDALGSLEKVSHMKQVKNSLENCDFGVELLGKCSTLLQTQGKDEQGSEKISLFEQLMGDERLPRVQATDGPPRVENVDLVQSLEIIGVFEEAVSHLQEATSLMSPVAFAKEKENLKKCVLTLLKEVAVSDEVLVLDTLALITSTKVLSYISGTEEDRSLMDEEERPELFAALHDRLLDHVVDDESWNKFVQKLPLVLRQLGIHSDEEFDEVLRDWMQRRQDVAKWREGVSRVLLPVCKLLKKPILTSESWSAELRAANPLEHAKCSLMQAINLQIAFRDVGVAPIELQALVEGTFTMEMEFDGRAEEIPVDTALANSILAGTKAMPVITQIEQLITKSVGGIFNEICTATPPKSRIPEETEAADNLTQILTSLSLRAGADTKAASAWLEAGGGIAPWIGDSANDVASQLFAVFEIQNRSMCIKELCQSNLDESLYTPVGDLQTLRTVLEMYRIVGKIASLFAWFLPVVSEKCISPFVVGCGNVHFRSDFPAWQSRESRRQRQPCQARRDAGQALEISCRQIRRVGEGRPNGKQPLGGLVARQPPRQVGECCL